VFDSTKARDHMTFSTRASRSLRKDRRHDE